MCGTISKHCGSLIPPRGRKWKFQHSIFLLGYGQCFAACFITLAHKQTDIHPRSRQPHIDGIVMTRTCRIRPGLWLRSRSERASSIIHRATYSRNSWGGRLTGWVTGAETEQESGNYSLFVLFPPPLLKEKRLFRPQLSKNIPFPSTFPSPNLKATLLFSPSASPCSPPPPSSSLI